MSFARKAAGQTSGMFVKDSFRFVWSEEKGLTNGKESDKIDLQFTIC